MHISIKQLVTLAFKSNATLEGAFAKVLGQNYSNAEYTLTQADADQIAVILDQEKKDSPAIGSTNVFGEKLTPDSWLDEQKNIDRACESASEIFKLAGLYTPSVWTA